MSHIKQILKVLQKETNICKRLYTLIPESMYSYRPMEGMRSVIELLKYMTFCSSYCIEEYVETDPEKIKVIYSKNKSYADTMRPGDFPDRMDEQMTRIENYLKSVSDIDLLEKNARLPWDESSIMGEAIMETSVKWLAGYKMQLFIYMKLNGIELDTGDCWIITYDKGMCQAANPAQ